MKKIHILPFFAAVPFILAGCNGDTQVSPAHQRKFHDLEEKNTLREVIHYGEKQAYPAPSTGTTRVFVVPIEFRDYPADEIGKYYNSDIEYVGREDNYAKRITDSTATGRGRDEARQDIWNIYFGDSEDTQWESLKSYYEKSSYGKLHFEGLVADWYNPPISFERPDDKASAAEWAADSSAKTLAKKMIDYYSDDNAHRYDMFKDDKGEPMFHTGQEFLQYFDSDKDGCFDLIELVYSAPFNATDVAKGVYDAPIDNDVFWAYCGGSATGRESVDRPTISKYAFFSYYTFVECGKLVLDEETEEEKYEKWTTNEISDGTAKMDAHTLIHETGHALGLPDFYDTDYSGKNASGTVDMMDHNIGDHNSYSKTQLGWVDPIVVTGPTEVTVRSFTETGDCIMVPYRGFYNDHPKYGNSSNIEYLALELYTPTGVNKFDSEHNYAGNYPKTPSISGIKIYHVDSRLGICEYNGGWKPIEYTEEIVGTSDLQCVMVAATNSGSTYKYTESFQLEFLQKSGTEKVVRNEVLYQRGDVFNGVDDEYSGFTMSETKGGEEEIEIPFGYKITILECSDTSATILFEAC